MHPQVREHREQGAIAVMHIPLVDLQAQYQTIKCEVMASFEAVFEQMQLFLGWVVMVAQKIVRFHDLDVTDLRRLEDFACAFSSGDIPARTHLAPMAKRTAHPNLRPNSND